MDNSVTRCGIECGSLYFQLQYQALGLTDSFDEKVTVNGSEDGDFAEYPVVQEGGGGGGEKGELRENDLLFDDPKYVSVSWVKEKVSKAQVSCEVCLFPAKLWCYFPFSPTHHQNGSEDIIDSRLPFAAIHCPTCNVTAHLYAKRARRKKNPSLGVCVRKPHSLYMACIHVYTCV